MSSDFSDLLSASDLTFQESEYYLHVGEPNIEQGWLLHISGVVHQRRQLLEAILPELKLHEVPFKVVKNALLHEAFNNGKFGHIKVGKIVTLFIEDDIRIGSFARIMIEKTQELTGPKITTDFRIGNNVYARYGAFKAHIEVDGYGNRDRLIMDSHGRWLKDKYRVPPVLPKGIVNPFVELIQQAPTVKNESPLKGRYFLGDTLKSDFKGGVLAGYYVDMDGHHIPCVIKRAKRGMGSDEVGRDMKDRLYGQYLVMESLGKLLPIPAVIDYWDDGEQAFLVTEYIKGRDLINAAYDVSDTRPWFRLTHVEQQKLIGYLLGVMDVLEVFHRQGYVHRDVTGTNFRVKEDGTIALIDLELVYRIGQEDLPFKDGTAGFMSPAQDAGLMPDFKDDIYSFGALMVLVFTSFLLPRLDTGRKDLLLEKLKFLIRNNELADIIIRCLSENAVDRPDWTELKVLLTYWGTQKGGFEDDAVFHYDRKAVDAIVTGAIQAIGEDYMIVDGIWFSYVDNPYDENIYPLRDKHTFSALHRGIGGVLYLLLKAGDVGYNISHLSKPMQNAWEFIEDELANDTGRMAPGLHYGASGLAVLLSLAVNSGMMPMDNSSLQWIGQCLQRNNMQRDVMKGAAGDGLAIMQTMDYLGTDIYRDLLDVLVSHLVRAQQPDGSWIMEVKQRDSGEVLTGFGYGVAGIVYFLLEYGYRYQEQDTILFVERGLEYLGGLAMERADYYEWNNGNHSPDRGVWWCQGGPGIAMTFFKAYEYTGENRYLSIAEKALRRHPKELVYRHLSQCHGISGLGELYLEAYRITNSQEWWDRASWIADLICSLKFQTDTGSVYWLTEQDKFPTADFMVGCSGVIHFLIRYLYPGKVSFPLLPEFPKNLPKG